MAFLIRNSQKVCAFCGEILTFPYMEGGAVDQSRAKCKKCKKNVFVFGKNQYQIVTPEELARRQAEKELYNNGKL